MVDFNDDVLVSAVKEIRNVMGVGLFSVQF